MGVIIRICLRELNGTGSSGWGHATCEVLRQSGNPNGKPKGSYMTGHMALFHRQKSRVGSEAVSDLDAQSVDFVSTCGPEKVSFHLAEMVVVQ